MNLEAAGAKFDSWDAVKQSQKLFDEKMSLDGLNEGVHAYVAVGIAFGVRYPEVVERCYRSQYSPEKWEEGKRLGVVSGESKAIPIEDRENDLMALAAVFLTTRRPGIVLDPAGLGRYAPEVNG
ncbi:MAG: hypothetical protein GEU73_14900 [Chloroflexi bacterium]|nr:hypothetical protein [Chloroflexota bacterium]